MIGFKVFNRIVFSISTTVLSVDLESNNCVFKEFLVTLFFVYEVSDFLGPFLQNFYVLYESVVKTRCISIILKWHSNHLFVYHNTT